MEEKQTAPAKTKTRESICQRLSYPLRYNLPIMGFLGYWLISALRLNMSLTILAMVNSTAVYTSSEESSLNYSWTTKFSKDGEFAWRPQRQGIVVGAFFWTIFIGSLVGGRLSDTLGSKRIFGWGMLAQCLLTLGTPPAARFHWLAVVMVRALCGLFHGFVFPTYGPLVRKWVPETERGFFLSIIYGGMHFGSFATLLVSGYICDSEFFGGWPAVYYIFGSIGCVWCLLFYFLIYETPLEHPWISDEELQYILDKQDNTYNGKIPPVPWGSILSCRSVWATVMGAFAIRWAQFHFYTVHPTYMASILRFPIAENGVLSSLPHLCLSIMVFVTGYVSGVIRRKNCMSVTMIYKSVMTIGAFGYVVCLFGVIGAGYNIAWNTALLIIAMIFIGIAYVGESVAPLEISSNYSGTIIGLCSAFSTPTGFLIPIIAGALTENEQTMKQWIIVFFISIAVVGVFTTGFNVLGTFERHSWDTFIEKTSENKNNEKNIYGCTENVIVKTTL